jgi:hypothetical protein
LVLQSGDESEDKKGRLKEQQVKCELGSSNKVSVGKQS